jgi:hypothetical protein
MLPKTIATLANIPSLCGAHANAQRSRRDHAMRLLLAGMGKNPLKAFYSWQNRRIAKANIAQLDARVSNARFGR